MSAVEKDPPHHPDAPLIHSGNSPSSPELIKTTSGELHGKTEADDPAPLFGGGKIQYYEDLPPPPAHPCVPQTPEFQAWFANSKVVDAEGSPLRLYQGGAENIVEFESPWQLYWFTTSTYQANMRALDDEDYKDSMRGGVIYPVYLSIKNPFDAREFPCVDIDGVAERFRTNAVDLVATSPFAWVRKKPPRPRDSPPIPSERPWQRRPTGELPFWYWLQIFPTHLRSALVAEGYDGVMQYKSRFVKWNDASLAFVAFHASQIRWAFG